MRHVVSLKQIALGPVAAVVVAAAWLVACSDQKVAGVVGQPVTITASLAGPAVNAWARVYSGPAKPRSWKEGIGFPRASRARFQIPAVMSL